MTGTAHSELPAASELMWFVGVDLGFPMHG
jgi:hypothetical protein